MLLDLHTLIQPMESCATILKEVVDPANNIFSHLLDLEGIRILLNCGSSYNLYTDYYTDLDIENVDFILLSHPSTKFVGALPYFLRQNFKGKIYATFPVKILGKLILRERCQHLKVFRGEERYSEKDVEDAFESIYGIKYLQPVEITRNITIVAYNSGHVLGGTIWKISKETENIVFGLRFDHRRTNHLNGIDMASLPKKALCIFDTGYVTQKLITRKDRNNFLKDLLEKRLGLRKKVLIIVGYDEFPEISLVLDEILWSYSAQCSKDVRASCIGFSARKFAELIKSMVEWSGENVTKEFMDAKENPFSFNHIDFFQAYTQMNVDSHVFVTFEDFGYTSKIFELLSKDKENLVLNFLSTDIRSGMSVREVPGFFQRKSEMPEVREEKPVQETKEEAVSSNKMWYETQTDVWTEGASFLFPVAVQNMPFDEYNEFFEYESAKENEFPEEEVRTLEKEEDVHEEVEMLESNFSLGCEVQSLTLDTVSDLKSSINVLEFLSPQKLVLISAEKNLGKLYFYRLVMNKVFKEVVPLEKELTFVLKKDVSRVLLDPKFYELGFEESRGGKYIGFRGIVEDNTLRYLSGISKPITIGKLDIGNLKKNFVEHNIGVEVSENLLVVEKKVRIQKEGRNTSVEGENENLYYIARKIIKNNLVYLD